MVNDQPG